MSPRTATAFGRGFGCWLFLAGATLPAIAQIPGLPGGAAVPGASGLGAGAGGAGAASAIPGGAAGLAGAAAPQKTIFGLFGISKAGCAACKAKICASPLGTLLNNGLTPYSTLSGGLIPQFCPTVPSDADIAALAAQGGPNGAGAVAAKIKQDEAEAKARRAAVRYLGTVDCHYWPDAEVAIIAALRDDRNECVRYEAALALLNGCCCNARTIAALTMVVSGSEKDGKPSETSERVRCTALAALQGCLLRYTPEPVPPGEAPPPREAPPGVGALDPAFRRVAYYYQALAARPAAEVVSEARRAVAYAETARSRATAAPAATLPGERSVYHALARAATPRPARPEGQPAPEEDRPPELAPIPTPGPAPTAVTVPSPTRGPATTPAVAARPAPRRPPGPGPATAGWSDPADSPGLPDPAVSRASARPAPSPSRRGLFEILRDSASPRPGT